MPQKQALQSTGSMRGNAISNCRYQGPFRTSLTYTWAATHNLVNASADALTKFRVTSIVDPDNLDTVTNCAQASYKPMRLRILLSGYGTRNSQKNMEVVVDRYTVTYPVNATVTLPNGSGNPINFNLGGSNVTSASGTDASSSGAPPIAAFAVSGTDYNSTNNIIDGCLADGSNCGGSGPVVDPPDPLTLDGW
jgi:hypothetical protein